MTPDTGSPPDGPGEARPEAGATTESSSTRGGLRARGRPGRRGRGTRRLRPERPCLNCGDTTVGAYCPACGQRKAEVLVSVRSMVADALEDEFVLNRRLPATLLYLFFRPGFLTLEHVNGRIARYIRPFRLYLVSSVVFFLLLSFYSLRMLSQAEFGTGDAPAEADSVAVASMDSAIAQLDTVLADPALTVAARLGLSETRESLERQRTRAVVAAGDTATGDTARAAIVREQAAGPSRTLREIFGGGDDTTFISMSTGAASVDRAVEQRVSELLEMTPRQAVERLVSDFLNYIPTMMFVLLPLFALVLKLLYVRRGRFYVEHFVFLLHTHAFVYLIFTLMLVLRGTFVLPGWLILTLLSWMSIYLFVAMKRMYGQGWFMTFLKGWVLAWVYVVVLAFSIPVALVVSLLFF